MTEIEKAAVKSALARIEKIEKSNVLDAMLFDASEYKNGYRKGAIWALGEIRKQLELCVMNDIKSPDVHLYAYIDKLMNEK